MASAPPTDGALFVHNPNSPEALDALLDAAGAPDPRDMGDALAYSFVGLDPAKPGGGIGVAIDMAGMMLEDAAPHGKKRFVTADEPGIKAIALLIAERSRQVSEGCKPEHDDGYIHGELARAAATYALPDEHRANYLNGPNGQIERATSPSSWPWGEPSWKPTPNDRLREVVKAGALLLAEAERLIRARPPG